jgi:hypothetical protein
MLSILLIPVTNGPMDVYSDTSRSLRNMDNCLLLETSGSDVNIRFHDMIGARNETFRLPRRIDFSGELCAVVLVIGRFSSVDVPTMTPGNRQPTTPRWPSVKKDDSFGRLV